MKRLFARSLALLLILAGPAFAARVAVFDFDDRLDRPDTVARFIEKKLREADPTVVVEQFSGRGDDRTAIEVLSALEAGSYDLIITITSDALIRARHVVKKTPLIYTNVNNPLFLGEKSLSANGGNISGASYYVPIRRQIELFRRIQPGMQRLGFLFDAANRSRHVEVRESRAACAALGLHCVMTTVRDPGELAEKAASLIRRGAEAVVATTSDRIYENISLFLPVCDRAGVPVYSYHKKGVRNGAVASLSSDYYRMAERLVIPMALRVLHDGASPGDMPVAFLDENRISLNLEQAGRLGLEIPPEILRDADVLVGGEGSSGH